MPARRVSALLASGALAAMVLSVPAVGQEVTGSNIKRKEAGATGRYSSRRSGSMRAEFNAYGRCFAEIFESKTRAALVPAYGEEEQKKAVDRLLKLATYDSGECFDADSIQSSAQATSYAGAFAEFFVAHRFRSEQVERLAGDEWRSVQSPPRNAYERFGACVVDASAPDVYAMINAVPDSEEEKAAIARIAPKLAPCVLEGQTVTFDRSSLRSALAVALYRELVDYRAYSQDNG